MSNPTKRKPDRDGDFPSKRQRVENGMNTYENNKSSSEEAQNPSECNYEKRSSKFEGVYWLESESKWVAQLTYRKTAYPVGKFNSEIEAAIAVNLKCQELNIPSRNLGLDEKFATMNTTEDSTNSIVTKQNKSDKKSDYIGVSWDKREQKWLARFTHKGKPHFVGYFDDELEAAIAVNGRCRYLNIPIKNPGIQNESDNNIDAPKREKKTSQYKHVNWDRSSKKWRAQMSINGKQTYIGLFETERAAAIAVNEKCQALGIPLRNQILELDSNTISVPTQQTFVRQSSDDRKYAENGKVPENGYSTYNCVFWDHQNRVWYGLIRYYEQDIHCGYFATEYEAAIAANKKCREIGIALKNPALEQQFIRPQSRYESVFWDDDSKMWTAKFEFKGMIQNLGNFTTDFEAAKAVNQKCEQYGIPPKNPNIGIDSNNNYSSENNNHFKMSMSNGSYGNNNHGSNHSHTSSYGTNGHPSNGTNGHPSNGTNGTPSNGTNGHPSNGTNGHRSNGTNGTPSNGTNGTPSNGHKSNGASNGHRSNGTNGTPSNGTNGTPSNGTNGTPSNGMNGDPSNGTNGHRSNGTNGHQSNGTNGHPSNGTNGDRSNGMNEMNGKSTGFNGIRSENGYFSTDAAYNGNGQISNDFHGMNSSSASYNGKSVATMTNGENGDIQNMQPPLEDDFDQSTWDALNKELEAKNRQIHENSIVLSNKDRKKEEQEQAINQATRIIQEQQDKLSQQQEIMKSLENPEN